MAYIFELLMEVKMMRNKNKTTYENLLRSIVFNEKSLLQFIKAMKIFLNSQVKENIKYYVNYEWSIDNSTFDDTVVKY